MIAKVNSDIMWFSPELDLSSWKHPEGKPMFAMMEAALEQYQDSVGQYSFIPKR